MIRYLPEFFREKQYEIQKPLLVRAHPILAVILHHKPLPKPALPPVFLHHFAHKICKIHHRSRITHVLVVYNHKTFCRLKDIVLVKIAVTQAFCRMQILFIQNADCLRLHTFSGSLRSVFIKAGIPDAHALSAQ